MAKSNSRKYIIGGIVAVLLIALWLGNSYNGLVHLDEDVQNKWGFVQSAYQRRADLIPNVVATVERSMSEEKDLLIRVTEARASVGRANTPAELAKAGAEMNSALSRLLVVAENYPQLTSTQGYRDLTVELEGTENRIKTERDNYNKAVRDLNVRVRRVPTNLVASLFGFAEKEYFEAEEGSENAPDVDALFNN